MGFLDGISEIHKLEMAGREATHDLHGQDFVVLRFWLGEFFCPGVTQSGPCESRFVPALASVVPRGGVGCDFVFKGEQLKTG